MKPLSIDVKPYGNDEDNTDNIRHALTLNLPEFRGTFLRHDGTFVIVGSGPSLPNFIEEIREEQKSGKPIITINGAHDFLCENGITPDVFITTDPRPMPQNFKHINKKTIYMLASRCCKESFEILKGKKILLWHSWSIDKECRVLEGKYAIGGGTTSGLRAINIGYVLGFRKFVLYGMDSCLAADGITKRFSGEKAANVIDIHVGGRTFYTNPAMGLQANEFQNIWQVMPDAKVEVKGDGLLAAIVAERKKAGLPC